MVRMAVFPVRPVVTRPVSLEEAVEAEPQAATQAQAWGESELVVAETSEPVFQSALRELGLEADPVDSSVRCCLQAWSMP